MLGRWSDAAVNRGDLSFEWGGARVYMPLATSILLSIVLTIILNLLLRR